MAPGPMESALPESSSSSSSGANSVVERSVAEDLRFKELRGVQWRLNLGILPLSSSIDDLRRVTADCRRRYARMRRRLLVDPPKDGSSSPDLAMDNPLSQNPESTWGRFFRNAELEKMVDQDLSRLYPEHGSYFQTPGCQGMLRRILLLWCLRHPECGYRQGMHELLAPLLYVLHVDVEGLSQVRKLYEDHFTDKFDDLSYHENDSTYNFDLKNLPDSMEDEDSLQGDASKVKSLDELDPKIQTIVMLSDAYGAEGELGIVLSEKFMEHDAYCMFDALMSGVNGSVSMAEFFSPSPAVGSQTSLPPVIEASAALYHLLSLVDSSLHSHLVELGVEPQYFALRWLRVLFGREFSLANLLIIWDEIFLSDNRKLDKGGEDDAGSGFSILSSPRGAFISALAVSMLLHLRSSLLATENATACLQRLLNFPENIDLKKLIQKATSLQALALENNSSSSFPSYMGPYEHSKSKAVRGHSLSIDSVSPKTPLSLVNESYWEEKWRVLHREEELRQDILKQQVPSQKKRWTEKVKLSLSRSESAPSPAKCENGKKTPRFAVRRKLLEDLSRVLSSEEDIEKLGTHKDKCSSEVVVNKEDGVSKDLTSANEDRCLNGSPASEENSFVGSYPASPLSGADEPELEKSSVGSNLSIDENDDNPNDDNPQCVSEGPPCPVSDPAEGVSQASECSNHSTGNSVTGKERKLLSGKFQRFWKLGWSAAGEGTSEKGGNALDATKSIRSDVGQNAASSSMAEGSNSVVSCKGETVDQNRTGTLRNLGHSMLDHIQVIESAFQQDRGVQVGSVENCSTNTLVGKGQVTAIAALKELRKISNLLSEM
ncbi:putative Rab-GTPase-TBC domain-containing protein [Rosa chinensis]|uniref:Putative Rab-GTPase-TBC domain-containing protein n=1 Tax=Rosa chinensis TaxID=74649 RepID=A0A2P6QSN6_ROSCH|nr:uncharacterized protein LOC112200984 isoform X1 [Rosa chinensis]PRQ37183.1 putative Rab-GTPase-TBC domain-containing protein [Rosa chinensis]